MILVDTSVWIEHLRHGEPALEEQLNWTRVLGHPWVTGEVALGNLSQRAGVIGLLRGLPQAPVAAPEEILALVEAEGLGGSGIGFVDAQLLASARLEADCALWTLDSRLDAVAERLEVRWRRRR